MTCTHPREKQGLDQVKARRSCGVGIAVGLSDRALKPVKTQVKISGRHRSEVGAAARLTVRSCLDSARKHGRSAFEVILCAFTGDLWMPPIVRAA